MVKFQKAILKVGVYQSPDGEVKVTPARLKHWADSFQQMKTANLAVPVSWDHDDDPKASVPVNLLSTGAKHRPAKGTVGYLRDVKLSPDGNSANVVLDIRGEENNRKVKDNLAFVSPVIRDSWPDGKGKIWTDIFGHMDLVQHPVDSSQTPFVPADSQAIPCGLRMGLDSGNPVTYRMAVHEDEDMADDDSTHDSDAQDTGTDRLKNVIEALAGMLIVLPEDTTAENFFERVESALLTAAAMGGGGEMSTDTEDLEEAKPEFAALSLDNKKLRGYADGEHRKNVTKRLDVILEKGQCTPPQHKKRLGELSSVRLSLDENGQHQPGVTESWIEFSESLPAGTFWDSEKRTRMSDLDVVPHPKATTGDQVTDEQADEIVAEINRRK